MKNEEIFSVYSNTVKKNPKNMGFDKEFQKHKKNIALKTLE